MLKVLKKLSLMLIIAVFLVPACACASTVFETTGWIIGTQGLNFEFTTDQSPYMYQASLTDLSQAPAFGFNFLFLSVTSSSDHLGSIVGSDSLTFPVESDKTYFANVFGTGGGRAGAGLFGLKVETVPIPGTVWIFGAGLVGLVGIRRKLNT